MRWFMGLLAMSLFAAVGLSCLRPGAAPHRDAPATGAPARRSANPATAVTDRGADAPSVSGVHVASELLPTDTIVALLFEGSLGYSLQRITVRRDAKIVRSDEIRLPDDHSDRSYAGPVATSRESCVVISSGSGGSSQPQVTAYQWRLGVGEVTALGSPSTPPWPGQVRGCGIKSYSGLSRYSLVFPPAPEALSDPPWFWTPGSREWLRLDEAYPALGTVAKRLVPAATYSPDGSRLAVAVQRGTTRAPHGTPEIVVFDVPKGRVATYHGPRRYVWALGVSSDNSELCWTEPDYPAGSGFGVLSLKTGDHRYWPLAGQTAVPKAVRNTHEWLFSNQATDTVAFSGDGRRIYFGSLHLTAFDRVSQEWQVLSTVGEDWFSPPHVAGFTVLPQEQLGQWQYCGK